MTSLGDLKRTFTHFAALVKVGSNRTFAAEATKVR